VACVITAGLSGCGVTVPGHSNGNGTGTNSTGTLVVSTQSVNFGSVAIGQTASATVAVSNAGSASVQIQQVQVQGAEFSVAGQSSAPISIDAGKTYSLGVSFQPTAAGATTGALILTSNVSSGSQIIVALSGTGQSAGGSIPTLNGLTCASGSITGSGMDSCRVTLTSAAGTGGLSVGLASGSKAVAVPSSVTVPAGAASASFAATVSAVTTPESVQVTARADGVTESYTIQLSATGPALTMSPASLSFGSVPVNTKATPQTVTLTSSGTAALTVRAASVSGAGFSLPAGSFPVTLQPGQMARLSVGFDPTAAGAAVGTVKLATNTSAGTATIALSGTGQAAGVSVPALNGLTCADNFMTGVGTDTCTVTLNAPAGSGGLTVSLASNSTAVSVPASVSVPAGASGASFAATVSAVSTAETAQLTATAGGITEHCAIQLGIGTPQLILQSTSVSFGGVSLNTTATQTVQLTSSGTAPLVIRTIAVTGAGFSAIQGTLPATLQPGQTLTLDIEFDPTVAGAVKGSVTLTTNTAAGTAAITLTGTGQAASYEVDLSWNAPTNSTDPVADYDIYRAVSGSSAYQLLNSSVDDLTTYADTTVRNGTAYTYYVVSVDASGNQSAPSNLFSATIPWECEATSEWDGVPCIDDGPWTICRRSRERELPHTKATL
jgi:hypothetical protein